MMIVAMADSNSDHENDSKSVVLFHNMLHPFQDRNVCMRLLGLVAIRRLESKSNRSMYCRDLNARHA